MILFLEYRGSGDRGGETYHRYLHSWLVDRFTNVDPLERPAFPPKLKSAWRHIRHSRDRVKRVRPRIVVCDLSSAGRNLWAVSLAERLGARVMLVVQGRRLDVTAGGGLRRRWVTLSERSLIGRANVVVANSEYSVSITDSRRKDSATVVVTPPGLETSPISDRAGFSTDRPLKLLFVGECSYVKGLAVLIEALTRVSEGSACLEVAGGSTQEPRYYDAVQRRVRDAGLEDRVRFHGFVERPRLERLYREADVLVVPSLAEGYGMAVAEAFCYGLPVIASDAGALGELVHHDVNGLLVPPDNSTALARAIEHLAADRSELVRFFTS